MQAHAEVAEIKGFIIASYFCLMESQSTLAVEKVVVLKYAGVAEFAPEREDAGFTRQG